MAAIEVGRICVKTKGRDSGEKVVITKIIDDSFVMIRSPLSSLVFLRYGENIPMTFAAPNFLGVLPLFRLFSYSRLCPVPLRVTLVDRDKPHPVPPLMRKKAGKSVTPKKFLPRHPYHIFAFAPQEFFGPCRQSSLRALAEATAKNFDTLRRYTRTMKLLNTVIYL